MGKIEAMKKFKSANLMLFTSFRETAGAQLFECNSLGTRVIALDETGAASWYINDLMSFVPVKFFELRKSLVSKSARQAIAFNNHGTKNEKDKK